MSFTMYGSKMMAVSIWRFMIIRMIEGLVC